MVTKKKAAPKAAGPDKTATSAAASGTQPRAQHTQAYEEAVKQYSEAIQLLRKGEHARAKERFDKLVEDHPHEPELAERSRTYSRICAEKLAPPSARPQDPDGRYHLAVYLINVGQLDQAIELLNENLRADTRSIRTIYARACAWALRGDSAKAVSDLRDAIAADPKVRFQAANDPDFEKLREEPAFIDIIEPTPTGA